ncbi:hypothetical protein LUZ60_011798 [Juncus effusus]|nr:hypothetical protein LUZ60_011798 [Juncus effusus]
MLDSGVNLATTLIGFVLSCGLIMFLCARAVCGENRAVDLEAQQYEIEMRSQFNAQQNILPECIIDGLERVIISAIPTIKYKKQSSLSTDEQCTICLEEYQDKEILRIMPKCGHKYHLDCIDVWLESHSTCPICRVSLYDSFQDNIVNDPVNSLSRNAFYRHFVNQWESSNNVSNSNV